jgi:hypothetical protein
MITRKEALEARYRLNEAESRAVDAELARWRRLEFACRLAIVASWLVFAVLAWVRP